MKLARDIFALAVAVMLPAVFCGRVFAQGLDANALHLRDDRLVGKVGRLELQKFGRVGEALAGRHRVDLNLRGVFISTLGSFHGRTFGTLSATGQEKYHLGFQPLVPGFKLVPYDDVAAIEQARSHPPAPLKPSR